MQPVTHAASRSGLTELPASALDRSPATYEGGTVSVIIPTYNCADTIADSLASVAAQSYSDLEIIVVDDGSDDATRSVVARSGVPCKYVRNERAKGPAGARNHGILLSKGNYIAFLDADDVWLEGKLATQVDVMLKRPQLVALGAKMVHWESCVPTPNVEASIELFSFNEMILRNRLCTPTVICRREALAQVGLFDEGMTISEDYELWVRLCQAGMIGCLNTPMARFRQRADGLSAGNRDRTYDLDMKFTRSLPRRYPEVPGIRRVVKQGLAVRALERAIELCDVESRYWRAFQATSNSLWNWPWSDPLDLKRSFPRLRRIRRISLDALTARRGQNPKNRRRDSQ